jgi:peptidyl-prolyl cis-trans isomerase SurA
VISLGDFEARMNLVLASSNIPDQPEIRSRIATQVMRQMIDERLELQEAKKEDVKVTDDDIKRRLVALARFNHIEPGELDKFLGEHRIDKSALVDQMTAEIAWARVVQRRYGHTVSVGDEEVNDALKTIEAEREKPEAHVAEIYLAVENPQQDEEVHQLADRLFDEVMHGASFQAVAQQFSQSPTAGNGGDIGWVLPGMLDADTQKTIDSMAPRTMTHPLRIAGGYYIYLLIDRRSPQAPGANVVVDLMQAVFPLAADADAAARDAVIQHAKEATSDTHSCGEIAKIGRSVSPDLSGPIAHVQVAELPAELRPVILKASIATPTAPVPVRGGIGVFMVCSRKDAAPQMKRDEVEADLRNQRLENIARRYLADLRRVAFIDLRV